MKHQLKYALILLSTIFTSTAIAQDKAHLKLVTTVQKVEVSVSDDGSQTRELVEANSVIPGDSVMYTITFENVSDQDAANVTITNPVPENLTYEVGSAFGPGSEIEFSVDGGKEYGQAGALNVTEEGEVRTAQPEDYTHIRWVMSDDLAAGAQGVARFSARLD